MKKRIEVLAWQKLKANAIHIYCPLPEITFYFIQYSGPIVSRIEPSEKRL